MLSEAYQWQLIDDLNSPVHLYFVMAHQLIYLQYVSPPNTNIPLVPDDPTHPPKKYNSMKKKSQYGHCNKQSSSAVSHHQGVDHHNTLASDVLSDALFAKQIPTSNLKQTPCR